MAGLERPLKYLTLRIALQVALDPYFLPWMEIIQSMAREPLQNISP